MSRGTRRRHDGQGGPSVAASQGGRKRRHAGIWLKVFGALVYLFLYIPLIVVIVFSFSPTKTIVGMNGVTLKWYQQLLQDENLLAALWHSVLIGVSSVAVSIVFGVSGAFFLHRVSFPGKQVYRTLVLLPYILPGVIVGLTLLVFVRNLNLSLNWFTILLGHVSFCTPIVLFQIASRLARMSPSYQSAAMDLGANPAQTFWHVTLPMIRTAIIGAALLAFTVSFDEIVISYFLTGTWMTLPVYIYGMLRFGLSPKVYAISAVILVFSLALIGLMARYTGRAGDSGR